MKIILFDNNQLKLFEQMKRPKISFSSRNMKTSLDDPGLKLMNLMRKMSQKNGKFGNESIIIKNIEESIPTSMDEKLKFFNILKRPI